MSGCCQRAVSLLTTPRRQGGLAVLYAAPAWKSARGVVERNYARCENVCHREIVAVRGRRRGGLCQAGLHALSSSSFEDDGQAGIAALREFVDKNYIPIALLSVAMLGYGVLF